MIVIVNGGAVRELRKAMMWTVPELSKKSGLSESTIHKLERGNATARISTVGVLAQTLGVDRAALIVPTATALAHAHAPSAAAGAPASEPHTNGFTSDTPPKFRHPTDERRPGAPALAGTADDLEDGMGEPCDVDRDEATRAPVERARGASQAAAGTKSTPPEPVGGYSRLEGIVHREIKRDEVPPPLVTAEFGEVPAMTARRMQNIFTAYLVWVGELFYVRGRIDAQRGLPVEESRLVGAKSGVGARFHIAVEVLPDVEIGVTVHTRDEEHTTAMQTKLGEEITVIVRVNVVPGGQLDGDETGFKFFMSEREKPWGLVVESVESNR